MKENDQLIKETLRDIFTYIGVDIKYADDAQLQTYLEWLIKKSHE